MFPIFERGRVAPTGADRRSYRLPSLDLLRGLVIVIMALDHVRDFFLVGTAPDPAARAGIGAALFFTRWITHFCAPVFVLLAGVSAGLMASRRGPGELWRFLFLRGLWLVAIEIMIISTAWTFRPTGLAQFEGRVLIPMQVIWVIGGSMILLSAAQWLGRNKCLYLGAAIVMLHNLLDPVWPMTEWLDARGPFWAVLHSQMSMMLGPLQFAFSYPLLPWIGVMLLGFGISRLFELPAEKRRAWLLQGGVTLTIAFVILRAVDIYGDPNPWQRQPGGATETVIDFLNTTKYPPSLLFLAMTLGPAAILCSAADRFSGWWADALVTFGRVPFAFYVAHLYLIHLLSIGLGLAQGFGVGEMWNVFLFYPEGYGVELPGVYVGWVLVIVLLYPLCRWFAAVKARRKEWWLSYL